MTFDTPGEEPPTRYRIRVGGHLDQHWSAWFDGLALTHEGDGTTSLTGLVSDQAQLHGLLTKVRDLGVPLISVAIIDESGLVRSVQGLQRSAVRQRRETP